MIFEELRNKYINLLPEGQDLRIKASLPEMIQIAAGPVGETTGI
jgi:hypothetical protein